jgi:hypothetical protein
VKCILLFAAFLSPTMSVAQVSCSPDVTAEMCKEVAINLSPLMDHGVLKGKAIPVELVTAKEYKKRMEDLQKDELAGDVRCTDCFSIVRRHALYNNYSDNIAFLRESTATKLPQRVLISSDVFEAFSIQRDANDKAVFKPNEKFELSSVSIAATFITGYIIGCYSQVLTG